MVGEPWEKEGNKPQMSFIKETPKEVSKKPIEEKVKGGYFDKPQSDETKKGIDVLFYGDSNTGKTLISQTFPEPIYVIDTEGRANKTRQYHFPDKEIKIFCPLEVNENFKTEGELEDAIDFEKTIDNITNSIIEFFNLVKEGKVKQGTLVIDTFSDLWSWIQEWGKIRLAKKDKVDLTTFRLKQQFDWGLMNSRHYKLIAVMRKLLSHGINLVGTARESKSPDYVKMPASVTLGDRIRAQKDVPFWFSCIVNLQVKNVKSGMELKKRYFAVIEKLETFDASSEPIENLNYEKLKKIIDTKRKEVKGGK